MALRKVKKPLITETPISKADEVTSAENQIVPNELEPVESIHNNKKIFQINDNISHDDKYVYFFDGKKNIVVGELVRIKSIKKNIDTQEYFISLEYNYRGKKHYLDVPRQSCLTRRELIKLQKVGLDVTERTAPLLVMHLHNEEKKAPETLIHSDIGFGTYEGKCIFKHFSGINTISSYCGKLKIEPKGSYSNWYSMVRNYIVGNIPLETMLVAGFSSAIVGMVGDKIGLDSLLIGLSGESTNGKSVSSMLAVSPWGNPNYKTDNALACTWNATNNGAFTNIVNNYGLTVLLDEISMSDSVDFTQFIYKLTGGKDKQRLDKDSQKMNTGTWRTTIICTGEFSLLEKSKKNTGLKVRTISIPNVTWTKDAESADIIQETVLNNYGYAGIEFVKHLIQLGLDKVCEELKELKEFTIFNMKQVDLNDKFVARRAWKYTVLMYTAYKVIEFLQIPLHIDEIWDFLMEAEKQSADCRDLPKAAFEYLIEQVNVNYKKFIKSDDTMAINDDNINNEAIDTWGKINLPQGKEYNEVCIYPELFKKIMKNGGFEDVNIILKSWKEQEIIDSEKDRYTRKRKLLENGGTVPVYVIRIPKEQSPDDNI
jgi:hypothetical protein